MYSLVLSASEREAMAWVGFRYATGDETMAVLSQCIKDPEASWDDPGDVHFEIPEHKAWNLQELWEQEDMLFPCFSSALATKLLEFAGRIV